MVSTAGIFDAMKYAGKVGDFFYGKASLSVIETLTPALQSLCFEIIKHRDARAICGHRGKEDQEKAFSEGKSKLHFPDSKHNSFPSFAVDIVPFPVPDWSNISAFRDFGFWVLGVADGLNIPIRWGADWNKNYKTEDEKFKDFPHFEIITF